MKKSTLLVILFNIFLYQPLAVFADDVIEDKGTGGINWTTGIVYANGYGVAPARAKAPKNRLLARRAAQVDAYRNLGEILSGVRVTSSTLVSDMEAASDTVKTKLNTVVKGAKMVSDHFQNDIATVRLEVDMNGDFFDTIKRPKDHKDFTQTSQIIFKKERSPYANLVAGLMKFSLFSKAYAMETDTAPQNALPIIHSVDNLEFARLILRRLEQDGAENLKRQLQQEIDFVESNSSFTGLLIDASKVKNFKIATIPKIRTPDGDIIYPKDSLLAGSQLSRRPVSYDFSVYDAIQNERVAIKPMVVEAESVYQSRNSDLIISSRNANSILSNPTLLEEITEAGVMIVVSDN